jgi:4-amino-4-deoxy-L-arabinose transferase-like glycosyltransferase
MRLMQQTSNEVPFSREPEASAAAWGAAALAYGSRLNKFRFVVIGFALAAAYLLFFHGLADRDLWSSHEARAAMDAQTILDDGAWDVPRLYDGRPELQKPPLYYWLVAAAARLRGGTVDAWAVRLPAASAALLCVLALAGLGRLLGRTSAGLLAAAALATAVHFTWLARIGRIDMPLTLAVTVALAAFYLARKSEIRNPKSETNPKSEIRNPKQKPGRNTTNGSPGLRLLSSFGFRICFGFRISDFGFRGAVLRSTFALLLIAYISLAVAVLLKGPIGAALVAATVAAHRLVEGELPPPWRLRAWGRLFHELGLWWGAPLVLLLAGPWFVWADLRTDGELFEVFFWYHNVGRGLGGSALATHPWWTYGPYFAVDFLPWTPLLAAAGVAAWRRGWWKLDPEARFGLAWLAAMLLLLSCAAFKRADYLLPAYPGAALFLGCVADRWRRDPTAPGRRLVAPLFVGLTLAASLFWAAQVGWRLPAQEPYRDYTAFAARVRASAPPPQPVLLFRTEAHALAFRLGRPLAVLVEWEELRRRLERPGVHYVVAPPDAAAEWPRRLPDLAARPLACNADRPGGHERPLVLLQVGSP